jgi:hypothetical protein
VDPALDAAFRAVRRASRSRRATPARTSSNPASAIDAPLSDASSEKYRSLRRRSGRAARRALDGCGGSTLASLNPGAPQ